MGSQTHQEPRDDFPGTFARDTFAQGAALQWKT